MDGSEIDKLKLDSLTRGYSLGGVLAQLEVHVADAYVWVAHLQRDVPDEELRRELERWANDVLLTLNTAFVSKAVALRFHCSKPDLPHHPERANLAQQHRYWTRALLDIRDELLEQRERIAVAVHELTMRMAQHHEIVALLRETHEKTEDIWAKVVVQPQLAPPIRRLLTLGVTQNAIWDAIKFGFGAAMAAAT